MVRSERWRRACLGVMVAACGVASGCNSREKAPVTERIRNPWLGPMRVAVAPALNYSGRFDFDPDIVADLMASELAAVNGLEVLPVSRTLAVLASQQRPAVESPAHAVEIAEALGADALLVFAITEYNPYDPPVVGIAAQLYGRPGLRVESLDPVALSRSAQGGAVSGVAAADVPLAQASRVYNAAHESVAEAVREYAARRDADRSPFGENRYFVSQRHYLRFCCHATIKELVQSRVAPDAVADPATVSTVWRP